MYKKTDWEKVAKSEGYHVQNPKNRQFKTLAEYMFYDLLIIQGVKVYRLKDHIRSISQTMINRMIKHYFWYRKNSQKKIHYCIDCMQEIDNENRFRCSGCQTKVSNEFDCEMI